VAKFEDRVKDTTTTTGTGDITLSGTAPTGFQALGTAFAVGEKISYAIVGPTGEWEIGFGVLSTSTNFQRTTVTESSNANALVNFSAGTKNVFHTISADFMDYVPTRGLVVAISSNNYLV
jgi:hypothetical protein